MGVATVTLAVHRLSDLPNARTMLSSMLIQQSREGTSETTPIEHGVTQMAADKMVRDGLIRRVTDAGDPRPSVFDDVFVLTQTGLMHSRTLRNR